MGGEAAEVALLPVGKRMVVTLGAVNPLAEHRPHRAAGKLLRRWGAIGHGVGDEVGCRPARPEALRCNHLSHNLVIRSVGRQLIGPPGFEAVAAKHQEGLALRAHKRPCHPLGKRFGEAAIGQHGLGPPVEAAFTRLRLKLPDLLKGGNRGVEREREPSQDREIFGFRGRLETFAHPDLGKRCIEAVNGGLQG